jgi:hypothetical protein
MIMRLRSAVVLSRTPLAGTLQVLAPLALVLAAGGTGCFRATGISRPDVVVEEIATAGGDRVSGLKATAGPGDYYLGNDSVHLAVDGAVYGDREGQLGAPSGGAILDVGSIALDQSFHRVSMPTDLVERLGLVANQDPDLPVIIDRFIPSSNSASVYLEMQGGLLDTKGKLGAAKDAQGRVTGVSLVHRITLNKADGFFLLETTLTNGSGATLPLRNVGDHLSQRGGGLRFVVPAVSTFAGAPLSTWGVEIPGSDFSAPLTTSVVAPMVGLMGAESADNTSDYHASLGILPLDVEGVLVASDPQQALTENRPRFPARLVVGSPAVANLAAGQSVSYRRRLYVVGGSSYVGSLPAQTTTVFTLMTQARAGFRTEDVGYLAYTSFGTAVRGGPRQAEFKFERYTYTGSQAFNLADPANPANQPANWRLERVEWREPTDIAAGIASIGMFLPVIPDGTSGLSQRYRITARNSLQQSTPLYLGTNALDTTRPALATPVTPSKTQNWSVLEPLSPERDEVLDASGNILRQTQTAHTFSARQSGTLEFGGINPLRITLQGVGVADPSSQRIRRLASAYNEIYKGKLPVGTNYGSYQYTAGNQVFGTAFGSTAASTVMSFPAGDYVAYATRGPLSHLDSLPVKAFDGQADNVHGFVVTPPTLPTGWTSFDVPGPTQVTTGGFNPGELLSSAVAEGIQVVTRTEEDALTDPTALQVEFRSEIDNTLLVSDVQRVPIGSDPFVIGARSASLSDGFTTALFTPAPTTDRNGGARPSKGWNLADFITQAEGGYTVIHRPRGPVGLFTVRSFDRTVALGSGANAWWNATGPASLGKRLGDFDALELLRGEGFDPANPAPWMTEFTAVRDDWFALLSQQTPTAFTKGLGLSSARYSLDTPVGLARTYLKIGTATLSQSSLTPVLTALRSGAAVASTGPMLDVSVSGVGPGGLVPGPVASVSVTIALYAPDWVPVDEVRVVVNGSSTPIPVPLSSFTASVDDFRLRTATVTVPLPVGKDAWLVVEAGVARSQTGVYRAGTPWNKIMKGLYPIAVTNPIFVDVTGGGYTPPGL